MAGSILGQDQINKVNAAYPRLLRHISDLLSKDGSAYGKMKIHFLTEYLDTTELSAIFAGLPFLAPAEKLSLVRAAIFDVQTTAELPIVPVPVIETKLDKGQTVTADAGLATYTPPRFVLNVNKAEDFHEQESK